MSDHRERIDTPIERPAAVLEEHRPYITTLADSAMQLSAAVNILGDVLHELRVARDPIGHSTREKIGRFGLAIQQVGAGIVGAFAPQLAKESP